MFGDVCRSVVCIVCSQWQHYLALVRLLQSHSSPTQTQAPLHSSSSHVPSTTGGGPILFRPYHAKLHGGRELKQHQFSVHDGSRTIMGSPSRRKRSNCATQRKACGRDRRVRRETMAPLIMSDGH